MKKRFRTRNRGGHKTNLSPGTLIVPEGAGPTTVSVTGLAPGSFEEQSFTDLSALPAFLERWPLAWVDVDGLGSLETIQKIGEMFSLHPLALEDVLNLQHRPKAEDYGGILFMTTHMATLPDGGLDLEQISLFVGPRFVVTFQQHAGESLGPVRERIRKGAGRRIRQGQSDYLAYAILDTIVDSYFPVTEALSDALDDIEESIVDRPQSDTPRRVHGIKRDLNRLRHAVWPMREVLNGFGAKSDLVHEETRPYLRDCHDHVIQIVDLVETCRERASGLTDLYLSSINNRMNEIMKILTMISTIFIPLSFIASVYGMNFDPDSSPWNMPELHARYGYPIVLFGMALLSTVLLLWFRKKGWFDGPAKNRPHDP
jgi:magnesium transporter